MIILYTITVNLIFNITWLFLKKILFLKDMTS